MVYTSLQEGNMTNFFKQLITDFHNSQIPTPSLRVFELPKLPQNVRKAFVFIGMRRSGKTWSLYQQMHTLMQLGIKQEQMLYINFADDRLVNVKSENLQSILDAYFELYPKYLDSKDIHFFFDEIHEIVGWERFIRRLLDTQQMNIYISGSSAKMLSKEIATTLRGRAIVREVFPFSFYEYLHFHKIEPTKNTSTKQQIIIKSHLQNFLQYGGFPEIVSLKTDDEIHRELLQSYIESVIYRDIIERYKVTNVEVLKRLLIYCLQNSASLLSINKTFNILKSQGFSISKNSLYDFMTYFEDTYCIFSTSLYNFSVNKTTLNPKKIYLVDQGLITAYTIKDSFEQAARLETTVFLHLRRKYQQIYYYKTKDGKEVDFLTLTPDGQISLYQVSLDLSNDKTLQRETEALQQAMADLNVPTGAIITANEEQKIKTKNGEIQCIPLWKFLLSDKITEYLTLFAG